MWCILAKGFVWWKLSPPITRGQKFSVTKRWLVGWNGLGCYLAPGMFFFKPNDHPADWWTQIGLIC